jgi:hypothetical protein
MSIDQGWVALGVSIATAIFWVGFYFGALRGRMDRLRTRVRDLEQAYEAVAKRPFVSRYPDDRP